MTDRITDSVLYRHLWGTDEAGRCSARTAGSPAGSR